MTYPTLTSTTLTVQCVKNAFTNAYPLLCGNKAKRRLLIARRKDASYQIAEWFARGRLRMTEVDRIDNNREFEVSYHVEFR